MPKTPHQIFSAFKDFELLKFMAEARNIEVGDKSRRKLIIELADHVSSLGLYVLLFSLKQDILKTLSTKCHWGKKDKTPTNKATLAKKIQDAMEEDSPAKFLSHCSEKVINEMLEYLEMDIPESHEKCVDALLSMADEFGLFKFFTWFGETKLKEFVKSCELKIDSEVLDTIVECLIEQESIKAPYKSDDIPSKVKPDLSDANISAVDLHHHYFREDLAAWCTEHKLHTNGSKKELVDRIRRFHEGKTLPRDKKKERENKRKVIDETEPDSEPKPTKKKHSNSNLDK